MCGIAGLWDRDGGAEEELRGAVDPMVDAVTHRGPDDRGVWVDVSAGLALGQRRLRVVDLSDAARQPMESADGRYVLVFNGEIYNFGTLRRELQGGGWRFRGSGDTEVLLAAIASWGLRGALERANGMFALAVWDRQVRTLSFACDRMGEKPLYYGWAGRTLLFGSELRALRAHRGFVGEVDRDVLALYLRRNCVPSPLSIYRSVRRVPAGTVVTISGEDPPGTMRSPQAYWSLRDVVTAATASRFGGDPDEALEALDGLLRDAVGSRMLADVPLGAFLSGGIDSSLVVALMQAQAPAKVRTFTIAFDDSRYDEAADARRVADHLGTEHVELMVTGDDALGTVERLGELFDEPFADSSQIPTYLLAALTRRHVTVALSGDGGDELFGGYNRYTWASRFWGGVGRVPRPARRWAARRLAAVSPAAWDAAFHRVSPVLPARLRMRTPGTKVQKVATVLGADDIEDVYGRLVSHVPDPAALVPGAVEPPTLLDRREDWPVLDDPIERMMYLDAMTYLPDDILTKVDRASMAVSLEARVPYLDHRVVAFAWSLPLAMKVRGGEGKWLLRRLLHRYVPSELVERPKMGFGPPIGSWLRGPLRPWAEELLDGPRLHAEGVFDVAAVRSLWAEHVSGRGDHQYELWDLLMFQQWLASTTAPGV